MRESDDTAEGHGWVTDVLGPPFERSTLALGRDLKADPERDGASSADEHPVATLVRYQRGAPRAPGAPARGTDVLYVHGWSDYFFQRELAEFWHRQGARFFALDLRRYGRSLRPGQTPGFVADLRTYDEEIAAALKAMDGRGRRLVLMGHSTGGLTLSLWAARNPGVASVLVLNSPWLEFQTGQLARDVIRPFLDLHARVAPRGVLPAVDPGHYTRSVAADQRGEWEYDHSWRPDRSFPIHPTWLRAVFTGHERVAQGLGLELPVLTMLSARSHISPAWDERMLTSDVVLDVDRMAERATRLGSRVTIARFDGALHDIVLSARPVREAAYAALADWLRYALR